MTKTTEVLLHERRTAYCIIAVLLLRAGGGTTSPHTAYTDLHAQNSQVLFRVCGVAFWVNTLMVIHGRCLVGWLRSIIHGRS